MPSDLPPFLELPEELRDPDRSAAWILPIPYERTSSYRAGSARLPEALLEASIQVELYDDELRCEPCRHGIATLDPLHPESPDPGEAIEELRSRVSEIARSAPLLALIGGEHTVTVPAVEAACASQGDLTVLQLDAHADLRDSYEGTPWSHACAMRRIVGIAPVVGVGIRALSLEEADAIPELPVRHFPARELDAGGAWLDEVIAALGEKVYVTVDMDCFDSSIAPAVGTPEPGGLPWYPTLALLRRVAEERTVVGCDVVEACPEGGEDPTAFLAARLLYKMLGYVLEARAARSGE